jgi:hypothetical protein
MTGTYLFVLETVLDPNLPLQYLLTIDMQIEPDCSAAHASFEFDALTLEQGSKTWPREPLGQPFAYEGLMFDDDGNFVLDMGEVLVAGSTNPITGSAAAAIVTLVGKVSNPNIFCGDVDGELTSPLNYQLTGSTFAAIRFEGVAPDDLPLEFPGGCEDLAP